MPFHSFILLAEMRTGSNFLESNLNAFAGITCHGEAFNPHFIGYPNRDAVLGVDLDTRTQDPITLLDRVENAHGINGFRFFHDHDPRILDRVLDDPGWAKIALTRNPAHSYVSWKTAQATGQWKLSSGLKARSGKVTFDAAEFDDHLGRMERFHLDVLHRLQASGQTVFYLNYDDIGDLDVLNGLAAWLGCADRRDALDQTLKKQGQGAVTDRVTNPRQMERALAARDPFALAKVPTQEPRRGPGVPSFVGSASTGLLFQPIRGAADLTGWLAGLGPVQDGFTQKTLRAWQKDTPRHRAITVLRHPVARAHAAFCEKILPHTAYVEIRSLLNRFQQVPLDDDGYDHQTAFKGFLRFLGRNLAGQTNIRIDPWWTTQSAVIEGFARFRAPDAILREADLADGLRFLGADPSGLGDLDPHADRLASIYDKEIENLARTAYRRDYISFGFDRWDGAGS